MAQNNTSNKVGPLCMVSPARAFIVEISDWDHWLRGIRGHSSGTDKGWIIKVWMTWDHL
jgi:hypothetical protein